MPNPTHESSFHERHETTPGRWLSHAFIALVAGAGLFLGGGTQKWGRGNGRRASWNLFARSPAAFFRSGWRSHLVLLAFLIWSLIAFLPEKWFFSTKLARNLRQRLSNFAAVNAEPATVDHWNVPQSVFLAGLTWLYVVCSEQLGLREVRTALRYLQAALSSSRRFVFCCGWRKRPRPFLA